MFLTHNFEWDTELPPDGFAVSAATPAHSPEVRQAAARHLRIPQTHLFDLWQQHRHHLLRRLSDPSNATETASVMSHVVRAVACGGPRASFMVDASEPWRPMPGQLNEGRFVLDYNAEGRVERKQQLQPEGRTGAAPADAFEAALKRECMIAPTQQEINVQLGEYHASAARKQLEVFVCNCSHS